MEFVFGMRDFALGMTVEPFMEWEIHMDNGMEWIMGGYGEMFGEITEWDG